MKKILWIASYPKSGNTFIRSLLSSLIFTEDGNFEFNLLKKIKQFDVRENYNFVNQINPIDYINLNDIKISSKYWIEAQKKINEAFIFKTHAANLMYNNYKYTNENMSLGVIYILRDPRDVAVSYSHHMNEDINLTVNRMFDLKAGIKSGAELVQLPLSSWDIHIKSWETLNVPKIIIKYEDLVNHTLKVFEELIYFLKNKLKINFNLNEDKFNNILKTTEFKTLQHKETAETFQENFKGRNFFRSGKHLKGSELDDINKNKIISNFQETMKKYNYI